MNIFQLLNCFINELAPSYRHLTIEECLCLYLSAYIHDCGLQSAKTADFMANHSIRIQAFDAVYDYFWKRYRTIINNNNQSELERQFYVLVRRICINHERIGEGICNDDDRSDFLVLLFQIACALDIGNHRIIPKLDDDHDENKFGLCIRPLDEQIIKLSKFVRTIFINLTSRSIDIVLNTKLGTTQTEIIDQWIAQLLNALTSDPTRSILLKNLSPIEEVRVFNLDNENGEKRRIDHGK